MIFFYSIPTYIYFSSNDIHNFIICNKTKYTIDENKNHRFHQVSYLSLRQSQIWYSIIHAHSENSYSNLSNKIWIFKIWLSIIKVPSEDTS